MTEILLLKILRLFMFSVTIFCTGVFLMLHDMVLKDIEKPANLFFASISSELYLIGVILAIVGLVIMFDSTMWYLNITGDVLKVKQKQ